MVYPIVTVRSQGSHLWDVDGNEYIDILNGFGPIMLGHRPEFVEKAIEQQLHEGFEIGPQTPLAGEIAQMYLRDDRQRAHDILQHWFGSGHRRDARGAYRDRPQQNRIFRRRLPWHVRRSPREGNQKQGGVPQVSSRCSGHSPRESCQRDGPRLRCAGIARMDPAERKELAAVLVEPVQSRHPHLQPVEFLKEIRKITRKSGHRA